MSERPNLCEGILELIYYILVIFQNALFVLSLFALGVSKKVRNRAGYSSLFSKRQSQKSSRPKTSILKDQGYIDDKSQYILIATA